MPETAPDLRFDRATYASPDAGAGGAAPCGGCKTPLVEQYWKWQRLLVCAGCRDGLAAKLKETQSASAFGRAFLQGGGAALACGIAYAVFVAATKIQFALATIGIAIVVARVVRKASGGVSGRRFQALAVALTYVAATMGYAPGILHALKDSGNSHDVASAGTRPATAPSATPPGSRSDPAPASEPPTEGASVASGTEESQRGDAKSHGPFGLIIGVAFLVAITLSSPFLEIGEAPIGVLIIAIGLWEAWRRTRGVPTLIEGPFRVAPGAAGLPPA